MSLWVRICIINAFIYEIFTDNGTTKPVFNFRQSRERGIPLRASDIQDWYSEASSYDTNAIHSLKEIYSYLNLLAECPYGHVKLQNLTLKSSDNIKARVDAITSEGNYLPYLNITAGSYEQKPAIVIIGGIIGCHWLTVAAAINLAKRFTIFYDDNYDDISRATWIIIPVLNPDGYNITLNDKEMRNWGKNMAKPIPELESSNNTKCYGVNLCLNFEYQWIFYNYKNSSWCDENYSDRPFSQNESQSLKDTLIDHLESVRIVIQLQQTNRLLMYPYRFSSFEPELWKIYTRVIKNGARAAFYTHRRRFQYGHVLRYKTLTAGELDDWVMAHLGVNFGFTFEIAEWKNNDVKPTRRDIQWTNDETFAALKSIVKFGVTYKEMDSLLPSPFNVCSSLHTLNGFVIVMSFLTAILFLI